MCPPGVRVLQRCLHRHCSRLHHHAALCSYNLDGILGIVVVVIAAANVDVDHPLLLLLLFLLALFLRPLRSRPDQSRNHSIRPLLPDVQSTRLRQDHLVDRDDHHTDSRTTLLHRHFRVADPRTTLGSTSTGPFPYYDHHQPVHTPTSSTGGAPIQTGTWARVHNQPGGPPKNRLYLFSSSSSATQPGTRPHRPTREPRPPRSPG